MAVDFVIAWVDGADTAWQQVRARYQNEAEHKTSSDGENRYRDWGLLRYWFRGVEAFAPWVNHIYFVTWGHVPKWLSTAHPKLTVVRHEDYIPADYLPTFNANTIELNFHRIAGLSEQFVYFNDDVFLLRPVRETDFFVDKKPKDLLALQPVIANRADAVMPYIYLNNAMTLAKYFDKRENAKKQPQAYFHPGYPPLYFFYNLLEMAFPMFTGFYTVHGPAAFLKQTYAAVWEKEGDLLDAVCRHRFRSRADLNQYLLREWQMLAGQFVPANVRRFCPYFDVQDQNGRLLQLIRGQKRAAVCINDAKPVTDIAGVRRQLQDAFAAVLPDKSTFERADV